MDKYLRVEFKTEFVLANQRDKEMRDKYWQRIKSLFHQALDLSSAERTSFLDDACRGDLELRNQVESLLLANDQAGEFIASPALVEAGLVLQTDLAAESVAGRRIGPYEVVRKLGSGGMGTVYLAARADEQFEKQVAIKIVKRGMDTESILRRFVMERQILANLEHPNIARLIDGGSTEDGLPYFVMEYIEGVQITKYCEVNRLSTNERLTLFRKVCAAVQYAHQNLVIHRDLKPANILVTKDGTPKLLDFGISKLLNTNWTDNSTDRTSSILRLMTPEYASPEQLRGLTITTAADVYSLGIVLYELLSGHRPFRFPSHLPEEMVRVLLTEEPERPSTAVTRKSDETDLTREHQQTVNRLSRSLRGDLDNIALKALRKDRERRYASVHELSEDIRRHLDGLPVNARPDTFVYRTSKFVRRHRAAVAMSSLMVVTLASATAITSWQGHVAQRERQKADRRFAEQRKLANSLITEVQKALHDVPHSVPAQRMLAQKSLEYLNDLGTDAGDDPEFLGDLATAYLNLGYLQSWTLQDNPGALLSYEKGIELCRKRAALEPYSNAAKAQLSASLSNKIESLTLMDRLEDVISTYEEKLAIEGELLRQDPKNAHQIMTVAENIGGYAQTLHGLKRFDQARSKSIEAAALAGQAIALFLPQAHEPDDRVEVSLWELKLGSMFEQVGDFEKARRAYSEGAAIAEAVHKEHPEIVQALRNTTSSHWYIGQLFDREGDHQRALEEYSFSLKTILAAIAGDPTVDSARYGETKYSIVVGESMCRVGRKTEGLRLIHRGMDILRNYVASDKGDTQGSYYGSELMWWAVEGLVLAGQTEEARDVCLNAIKWVEQTAGMSDDPNPWLRLPVWYEELGDISAMYDPDTHKIKSRDRVRLKEAKQDYQKAFDVLRDSTAKYSFSVVTIEDREKAVQEKIDECDSQLGL